MNQEAFKEEVRFEGRQDSAGQNRERSSTDAGGLREGEPGGGNKRGVLGKLKVTSLMDAQMCLCRRFLRRRTEAGKSWFLLNTDQAHVGDWVKFKNHL